MSIYPFSEWMAKRQEETRARGEKHLPNFLQFSRATGFTYSTIIQMRYYTAQRFGGIPLSSACALQDAGFDAISAYRKWLAEHPKPRDTSPVRHAQRMQS